MAKRDNQINYNINFTSNVDSLVKQTQSGFAKLKLNFDSGNPKSTGYLSDLEKNIKNFVTKYKNMIKDISKPGTSSKQITSIIGNFESEIKILQKDLGNFKSSMHNTFSSQANKDSIEGIANLTKELNRLKKAAEDIDNLKTSKSGLLQKASGVMGKRTNSTNLRDTITRYDKISKQRKDGDKINSRDTAWIAEMEPKIKELREIYEEIQKIDKALDKKVNKVGLKKGTKEEIATKQAELTNQIQSVQGNTITQDNFNAATQGADDLLNVIRQLSSAYGAMQQAASVSLNQQEKEMEDLKQAGQTFKEILGEFGIVFSAAWAVRELKQLATASFDFYRSLDKALTDISIVSDLGRDQVQGLTGDFIELSRQTGMAIDDIAQASVIFFQQGLGKDAVLEMTEVTAQFAKVAGISVESAADKLTAAVNGYQVGVEGAMDVADKFNAVAAKSAASIDELSTAFEKGASMANQAGISMDNYLGYLATMVEVTREAPENIGTSMKTIMARFQQIKESGTSEDGDTDVNNVETALKSVGVALRDDNNQLRDLEAVLEDLGPKWNSLDRNTQAYLGTVIAGTRQQSRFISLMQNWDRALELSKISQDSAGMQTLMHVKAMDSLDASIQRLTNSWQKFLANLTESDVFIGILNKVTKILDTLSDDGARTILIVSAVSAAIIKMKDKIASVGKALVDFTGRVKTNITEIKNSAKAFKTNISSLKAYADAMKEIKNVQAKQTKVDDTQAKLDNLETEASMVDQSDVARQQELAQAIAATKQELQQYTNELNKAKEGMSSYAQSMTNVTEEEKKMAMQSVQTTAQMATGLLGLVMMLVTALDGLDSVMGQAAIGIAAALAAIVIAFQVADKAIKATGIGALISYIIQIAALAITAITALWKSISSEMNKGKKALEDCNEAVGDLAEGFKALNVGIKAAENLKDRYDELHNKIALTKEEQEELNNLIQQMSDTAGIDMLTDKYGNNVLNEKEYNEWLKNQKEEREKQATAIADAQKEMTKKTAKVGFWETTGNALLSGGIGSLIGGPLGGVVGTLFFGKRQKAAAEKHLKEAKDNLRAHFKEYKDEYMSVMGDLNDTINENTLNAEGQVIASTNTKRNFENAIKERAQKDVDNDIDDMSKEELEDFDYGKALEKKYEKYQKKFGKYLDDLFIETDKLGKETTEMTYGEMEEKIDAYLDKIKEKTGASSKEIKALKEGMMDSIYGGDAMDIRGALDDIDSRIGTFDMWTNGETIEEWERRQQILQDMKETIQSMKPQTAASLNSFGLFDAGNEELFSALKDSMPDIDEAFAESGDKGVEALYTAIQEAIDNGEIKGDELIKQAQEIQKKAFDSLGYSASISWGDLSKELDAASEKLRTLNDLSKSLAENGGWTLDEFADLAGILDSIDITKLDPASLEKYTAALDTLNLGFDASEGLITAEGDAIQSLQTIQEAATKAQIAQTIDKLKVKNAELEAEIAFYDAEISANEAAIDYLTNSTDTEVTLSKAKEKANTEYANQETKIDQALATTYQSMADNSSKWATQTIDGVSKVGEAFNKLLTGDFNSIDALKGAVNKAREDIKWSGQSVLDDIGFDENKNLTNNQRQKAAQALKDYNTKLANTKASLESQKKNINAEIVLLQDLYDSDLSRLGSGKADSKGDETKIEQYIGRLKEIYNILNRIGVLEHRLSTLDSYADVAEGERYGNLLKERLDYNKELMGQYEFLTSEQKQFTNGYKDFIQSVDGLEGVFDFDKYGQIIINWDKYNSLQSETIDGQVSLKEKADDLYDTYTQMFEDLQGYFDNTIKYYQAIIELEQEAIDAYVDNEVEAANAMEEMYKKILDDKLEAIDAEIDALNELKEARQKAYEEQKTAKEVSGLQTNLQRAMLDTSGASNSAAIKAQQDLDDKLDQIAEDKYSEMLENLQEQLEDEKEALQDNFDSLFENLDWLHEWLEADILGDESKLYEILSQTDSWQKLTEVERAQKLADWKTKFETYTKVMEGNETSGIMGVYNNITATKDRIGQLDTNLQTAISKGSVEIANTIANWQKSQSSSGSGGSGGSGSGGSGGTTNKTGNTGKTSNKIYTITIKDGSTTKVEKVEEGHSITLGSPTKSGYKFTGWDIPSLGMCTMGSYTYKPTCSETVTAMFVPQKSSSTTTTTKTYNSILPTYTQPVLTVGGVKKYATGGFNTDTGLAWLDGTKSSPEAVLNNLQTKHFIDFTNTLDKMYNTPVNGMSNTSSSINIESISFNVASMSSEEDGEKAFNMFVEKFKEIGNRTGLNVQSYKNNL